MTDKIITEKFIKRNTARILSLIGSQPRYKPKPYEVKDSSKDKRFVKANIKLKHNENPEKIDRGRDMLLDIYNRFDIPSSKRATDLGLSAEASNKIYKFIEREQLVEPIHLNLTGKQGGQAKYHILTNKGCELIEKPLIKRSGGAGAKHFFLQRYLKKYLPALGFSEIQIEKNIGGKKIDLFGKYNNQKTAIEICVSTFQTEYNNVLKDIDNCDVIFIVTTDKKSKQKLEEAIYKRISRHPKLKICIVHELLNPSTLKGLMNERQLPLFDNL